MKKTADKSGEGEKLLTLDERMALFAQSKAFSPESAAAKVKAISRMNFASLIERADIDVFDELTNEYLGADFDENFSYHCFCRCKNFVLDPEKIISQTLHSRKVQTYDDDFINAVIKTAFVWIKNYAKPKERFRDMCYCMKMTLGDYLDALIDLCFIDDNRLDNMRCDFFRSMKRSVSEKHDPSKPLAEVIADVLREYIEAWKVFDRLQYIRNCDYGLVRHMEEMRLREEMYADEEPPDDEDDEYCDSDEPETDAGDEDDYFGFIDEDELFDSDLPAIDFDDDWNEPDEETRAFLAEQSVEEYMIENDPYGYYYDKALNYPMDSLFVTKDINELAEFPADDFFVKNFNCDGEHGGFMSEDLAALYEKYADKALLADTMNRMERQASLLFLLLIEPFNGMELYHYERHLDGSL